MRTDIKLSFMISFLSGCHCSSVAVKHFEAILEQNKKNLGLPTNLLMYSIDIITEWFGITWRNDFVWHNFSQLIVVGDDLVWWCPMTKLVKRDIFDLCDLV